MGRVKPAILLLCLPCACAWPAEALAQVAMEPRPVLTDDLTSIVAEESPAFRGVVAPIRQSLLTAPIDGVLAHIRVAEGQVVEAGVVLAEMDDTAQRIAVDAARLEAQAEGKLLEAQLVVDEAQITLDRVQASFERKAAAEWEVRRATLQRDQAAAGLRAAEEQRAIAQQRLKLEEERLRRLRLYAPFAGHVTRVELDEGATVARGDTVLRLVSLESLEAELLAPADLFGKLQVGESYKLHAEAPIDRELWGTLKSVEPVIDAASGTVRCVFHVPNPAEAMPAGFIVQLPWPQSATFLSDTGDAAVANQAAMVIEAP